MRTPTDEEIAEALKANTFDVDGRWYFKNTPAPRYPRDYESTRDIVRSCLALDVVVTDQLSSAPWAVLLRSVAELAERVDALEKKSAA